MRGKNIIGTILAGVLLIAALPGLVGALVGLVSGPFIGFFYAYKFIWTLLT